MTSMVARLHQRLKECALDLQTQKSQWLSYCRDSDVCTSLPGSCPIPRVAVMQCMGIPIGAHPFTTHALHLMEAKVRGCLWGQQRALRSTRVPRGIRLRAAMNTLTTVAMWSALFLAAGDTHLQRLRRLQTSAARWVLRFGCVPDEPWLDWWRHSWRQSKQFLMESGTRSWARLSVQLKLQWAGHVARLPPT
eukprot:6485943-Amphidinium_carterae.1